MNQPAMSPTKAFLLAVAVVCIIRVPILILTRNWESLTIFSAAILGASLLFFGYRKFKS